MKSLTQQPPSLAQASDPEVLMKSWRKVRANNGMPGVDGESISDFASRLDENIVGLSRALKNGRYQPRPVRRIWRLKLDGEGRPIAILTVRDRIVQRAVYEILAPHYEQRFLPCSVGYREGMGVESAIDRIAQGRNRGLCWVIDGDIEQCFDRLDHRVMLDLLRREVKDAALLHLIHGWLTAKVMNDLKSTTHRSPSMGAAQGGALSPLLSNIYLHEFDAALTNAGLWLTRYADDWLIQCLDELQAQRGLQIAKSALGRIALTIKENKTKIKHFDKGFCFCGVFFLRDEQFVLAPGATLPKVAKKPGSRGATAPIQNRHRFIERIKKANRI
jgi:RNA-directed DNA polymerase